MICLLIGVGSAWAETVTVTDDLNQEFTGISGTAYTDFSGKTGTSSAVYAGNCAGGNSSIQLRSSNSNSGIITTVSGGKVRKITVEWNSNTANGRSLNIYGKNEVYTSAADLYNDKTSGNQLGQISCGTSTTKTITGDYKYIGIRSNSGAMYLTSITIEWEKDGSTPVTHTAKFYVNGEQVGETQTLENGAAINFPSTPADINGKTFAGWSESTIIGTTNTAPTFVSSANMGDADKTYYAVFATKTGSAAVETKTQTLEYDTWTYGGSTTDKTKFRLFHDGGYIESASFDRSKLTKVVVYGGTFGGTSYNKLTIGDGTNTWKSVTVSGSSETGKNSFTEGTALSGNGPIRITSNSGSASANGVRITKVEIYTLEGGYSYSDYCTTVASSKTLTSISVSGTPTKTTYTEGDVFAPAGLVVTGTYSDASTETITEGITWNVTPESLAAGTTSVSVTATVNGKTSAAYIVNGLTVNTIPEKTIAEFIASEGGKCYLIGTVSNIVNTTFGNFDLTDESGTIYVYGCLTSEGAEKQFESLGIKVGDKIKVLANEYELYMDKNEAKNVVFVEKITVAPTTYTIAIDEEIANGTVEASAETAAAGATITLSATPSDGYEFGEWTVIDNGLNEIAVTNNQFTMPASDVLVSATFTEVQGGGDEPAERPENEIFYESFNTNVGTGGNDGQWSGSIASNAIQQDNEGWIFETGSGADKCAKFGSGSKLGTATTPALGQACDATLTFKAAAWNGSSESTTLKLSVIGGGTVSPATITLTKGAWNTFSATLTGLTDDSQIKFEGKTASNSRFFLDEISVVSVSPKVISSFSIKSAPTKVSYIETQKFDPTGLVITADYGTDGTEDIAYAGNESMFSFDPSLTTALTTSDNKVTVTYGDKNVDIDITVAAEELTSIELGGNYTKNFEQNATFNHDGLTVTAHYNSGRTADVTDEATVSTPDMSTLGEQTITVSYGGKEATYTIKVAGFYTVTIDNTHDTNGTISVWNDDVELTSGALVLDGTKLTIKCTPADGYKYKTWQYKDKGDWNTKYTNYDYWIAGSNVSFRANFEEIPLYTITYYVNGVPTTEEVREGAALNFPANPTMAGKVFRGWIDKVKVDDSSVKPTFVTATKAQGNATFFAVFATETTTEGETGSDVWEKVPHDFNAANLSKTDETKYADWIADGNQYLIVYEASSTQGYVFNGTGDDKDYKTVTITDGKIADDASFVYITMSGVNSNHVGFTVHGSANDGLMMNDKQGSNGMKFYNFNDLTTISDRAYVNNDISTNNYSSYDGPYSGQWSVKGSNGYLRFYTSSGSNYFRYYTTKTTGNPVEFYVKKAATGTTTEYSDFTTNMDVIERNEVNGKYFTICYPYAVHPKAYPGAKAYNIVGKTLSGDRIATLELEEVDADTPLEAGMPYFMVGDQTNFMGYHSLDNSVDEARNHNGLYGVFVDYAFKDDPNYELNEYYVIYSNAVKAGSVNSGVKANRAFIKKSEVPDYVAPTESAARFVIELEAGTLTELDEVELKPIETSIYNLQGQRINRAEKGVYIVNGRKVIR